MSKWGVALLGAVAGYWLGKKMTDGVSGLGGMTVFMQPTGLSAAYAPTGPTHAVTSIEYGAVRRANF